MGFFSKKKEIKENNEDESILKEELETEVENKMVSLKGPAEIVYHSTINLA